MRMKKIGSRACSTCIRLKAGRTRSRSSLVDAVVDAVHLVYSADAVQERSEITGDGDSLPGAGPAQGDVRLRNPLKL